MNKEEIATYYTLQQKIYSFCNEVLERLEDYDDIMEGGNVLEDAIIDMEGNELEIVYSNEDSEGLFTDSFFVPLDLLISEDVDACCKAIIDDIREMDEDALMKDKMNDRLRCTNPNGILN